MYINIYNRRKRNDIYTAVVVNKDSSETGIAVIFMPKARRGIELLRMREMSVFIIASRYPNRDMEYVCNRDMQTGGQTICSNRPS